MRILQRIRGALMSGPERYLRSLLESSEKHSRTNALNSLQRALGILASATLASGIWAPGATSIFFMICCGVTLLVYLGVYIWFGNVDRSSLRSEHFHLNRLILERGDSVTGIVGDRIDLKVGVKEISSDDAPLKVTDSKDSGGQNG